MAAAFAWIIPLPINPMCLRPVNTWVIVAPIAIPTVVVANPIMHRTAIATVVEEKVVAAAAVTSATGTVTLMAATGIGASAVAHLLVMDGTHSTIDGERATQEALSGVVVLAVEDEIMMVRRQCSYCKRCKVVDQSQPPVRSRSYRLRSIKHENQTDQGLRLG
jgi:hypothetical protein